MHHREETKYPSRAMF